MCFFSVPDLWDFKLEQEIVRPAPPCRQPPKPCALHPASPSSFWRFSPVVLSFCTSEKDISLWNVVCFRVTKGPFWGSKRTNAKFWFQDPKNRRDAYKTRENPTRPQLASSHWWASSWTKMTINKWKSPKNKCFHFHAATHTPPLYS